MHHHALLCATLVALPLAAQNWYVPDNLATIGTCNVIPFGQPAPGSFSYSKMQTRCTAADLGNVSGVITGLAFAACNTGRAHYDRLEIVLDHIPAAQALSTTFAANLTASAVAVLDATNYTWHHTANGWNEVGLQNIFVYNGTDDLLVEITATNGIAPGGVRRDTRQRIYWIGAAGPAPATGTSSASASKIEVSMLTARASRYGDGCPGSNGSPQIGFTGVPQLGTTFSIDLQNGVPTGLGVLVAGTTNAGPFPLDLGFLGMTGCLAYTDLLATGIVLLDGAGAGSFSLPLPATLGAGILFYAQYACLDPAANPFGLTSSDYGRILVGN